MQKQCKLGVYPYVLHSDKASGAGIQVLH